MNDLQKIVRLWLTDIEDLRAHDDRPAFLRAYFQERSRQSVGASAMVPRERRVSPLEW